MDFVISLVEWLQANPQLSMLVFVLAFAAILAVGVPGGNALMLSSGLLFGTWLGAALATLGAGIAALATYVLVRTAFGRWLDERAAHAHYSMNKFLAGGNGVLLVLPRLVPVIPFFVINIGMAAARVPVRTYLWTTVLGVFPVAILFSSIGSELRSMQEISRTNLLSLLLSPGLAVPLALLIVMTLAGWVFLRDRDGS